MSIKRIPPTNPNSVAKRLKRLRAMKREKLLANATQEDRIEFELAELDQAIVGLDALDAAALRRWAEKLDRMEAEAHDFRSFRAPANVEAS